MCASKERKFFGEFLKVLHRTKVFYGTKSKDNCSSSTLKDIECVYLDNNFPFSVNQLSIFSLVPQQDSCLVIGYHYETCQDRSRTCNLESSKRSFFPFKVSIYMGKPYLRYRFSKILLKQSLTNVTFKL